MGIPNKENIAGVWIPAWVFDVADVYGLTAYAVISANQDESLGWGVGLATLAKILKISEEHANNLIIALDEAGVLQIMHNNALRVFASPPEARTAEEAARGYARG